MEYGTTARTIATAQTSSGQQGGEGTGHRGAREWGHRWGRRKQSVSTVVGVTSPHTLVKVHRCAHAEWISPNVNYNPTPTKKGNARTFQVIQEMMNRTKSLRQNCYQDRSRAPGRPPVLLFNTSLLEGPYSSVTCLLPRNAAAHAQPVFGATILGAVQCSTPRVSSPLRPPPPDSVAVPPSANIHSATTDVPVKHVFCPVFRITSLGQIPRNGITGTKGKSIFYVAAKLLSLGRTGGPWLRPGAFTLGHQLGWVLWAAEGLRYTCRARVLVSQKAAGVLLRGGVGRGGVLPLAGSLLLGSWGTGRAASVLLLSETDEGPGGGLV